MIVALLGSAGIGLVWGWLVGSLHKDGRQTYRAIAAVMLATLIVSVVVFWFLAWRELAIFLGTTLIAYLLHIGWQWELRHRFKRLGQNKEMLP